MQNYSFYNPHSTFYIPLVKIALVVDWLPTFGGAEHVIAEFHALWPKAPIYTTIANHGHLQTLDNADIRTSKLQWIYRLLKNHRVLLPLMTKEIEHMDLRGYDIILSSSHAIGKGIIPPSTAKHICYCHTPMRYAWEMEAEYLADSRIPKMFHRRLQKILANIRRWDLTTAKRVDVFIANSSTTQERIQRIYNRDSVVIPPPVSDAFFGHELTQASRDYYLAVGRLVPYKRFDLLIQVANELQIPLKIAGTGPEMNRLQKLAGKTVELMGYVPEDALPSLYGNAKALLFPQLEDAGIVPLEAQACGTPVIAFGQGGIRDTVVDGTTGVFFAEQTVAAITAAIHVLDNHPLDAEQIRKHASLFNEASFKQKLQSVLHAATA